MRRQRYSNWSSPAFLPCQALRRINTHAPDKTSVWSGPKECQQKSGQKQATGCHWPEHKHHFWPQQSYCRWPGLPIEPCTLVATIIHHFIQSRYMMNTSNQCGDLIVAITKTCGVKNKALNLFSGRSMQIHNTTVEPCKFAGSPSSHEFTRSSKHHLWTLDSTPLQLETVFFYVDIS